MKKLFLLLILMAVSVSFAQAATVDTKAGTKALLFQFSGLDALGASGYFQAGSSGLTAYGIGMRYYIQNDLAIRPAVLFGYQKHKNNAVTPAAESKDTAFGVNVALEKHMGGPANVSPYLGAAVGFDYLKNTPAGSNPVATKITDFNIGLLAGFQWGFTDNLSLGGEYVLGFLMGKTKTDDSPPTIDSTDTGFGFNTAALYLSVSWP